jgi:RNA polymerase sigma-70 factor (ECF subfamily)
LKYDQGRNRFQVYGHTSLSTQVMLFDGRLSESAQEIDRCLLAARQGSVEALGRLMELCRPYLLSVSNAELELGLRAKVAPSDIVQQTFVEAQKDFPRFEGATEAELRGWLRRILLNNLADTQRRYGETDRRNIQREVPLDDPANATLLDSLIASVETPSQLAAANEEDATLQRALAQLPAAYRAVIRQRSYERRTFEEIAEHMGRSAEAARKLWTRAVEQVQRLLESSP